MTRKTFLFLCLPLFLSACSWYDNGDRHTVMCNKLKSAIIFNGGTNNTRRSEIETAEKPLNQRTFNANCE